MKNKYELGQTIKIGFNFTVTSISIKDEEPWYNINCWDLMNNQIKMNLSLKESEIERFKT